MFKRKSLLVGLVLVLLFSLTVPGEAFFGFGGDDEEQEGPVEIRFSGWTSSPTEGKLVEKLLEDFEEDHPNIKVKYEPIQGSYMDKLQTQLASGTAPDVFYLDSVWLPAMASKGVLKPLDDYMAEDNVQKDEFISGLINGFEYDGTQYGIPKDYSTLGLFYNKRMFEEAGIEEPPQTWEELYQVAKKLTRDTDGDGEIDEWGMTLNTDLARFIAFLHQNDGQVLNEQGNKTVIDNQAGVEALKFYNKLYQEGYAVRPGEVGAQWLGDALGKDKVGMVVTGNWTIPFMNDQYPEVDFGVAQLPKKEVKSTMAFTVAYCIDKNSEHPEAAWELVKYLTSEEGQRRWASLGLAMPSRKELADMVYFDQHPRRQTLMNSGEFAKAWQFNEHGQQIIDRMNTALQAVLIDNQKPEQVLSETAEEINQEVLTE